LSGLAALKDAWLKHLRIGLFQNDFTPFPAATISNIEPCDYSGYVGLRTLTSWLSPTLIGPRATVEHAEILWPHDGGLVWNFVFGYYVIDLAGKLVRAERGPDPPETITAPPDVYRVVPRYTFRSEF
jgi:hypothetical protein